jgi:hypothetical protein
MLINVCDYHINLNNFKKFDHIVKILTYYV